jgi:cytochrome c1
VILIYGAAKDKNLFHQKTAIYLCSMIHQGRYIVTAFFIFILLITCLWFIYKISNSHSQNPEQNNSKAILVDNIRRPQLTESAEKGKFLFERDCASCHKLHGSELLLANYRSKWPDKKELFAFIRYPQEVEKRNSYVKELVETFGVRMLGNPKLSDEEISLILNYMDFELTH